MTQTMDERLMRCNERMIELFGESIPLRRIPASANVEEIEAAVEQSAEAGRNMLPELLGYSVDSKGVIR